MGLVVTLGRVDVDAILEILKDQMKVPWYGQVAKQKFRHLRGPCPQVFLELFLAPTAIHHPVERISLRSLFEVVLVHHGDVIAVLVKNKGDAEK